MKKEQIENLHIIKKKETEEGVWDGEDFTIVKESFDIEVNGVVLPFEIDDVKIDNPTTTQAWRGGPYIAHGLPLTVSLVLSPKNLVITYEPEDT